MSQPLPYYEGRLDELSRIIKEKRPWPWRCQGLKSRAIADRYATFKGYQEHYETSAQVFQATLDSDAAQDIVDERVSILANKEAGRASAYAFLCDLLLPYLDEGMTEHQLKVLVARVEQEIAKTKLLFLGEEP